MISCSLIPSSQCWSRAIKWAKTQFSVVKQLYRGAGEGRKQRSEKGGGLPNTFDCDCGHYINVLH